MGFMSYESSRASEYATVDGPSTSVIGVGKPHSSLPLSKSAVAEAAAPREVAAAVANAAVVAAAPLDPGSAHSAQTESALFVRGKPECWNKCGRRRRWILFPPIVSQSKLGLPKDTVTPKCTYE